ncbi:hypothetical protein SAMN05444422_111115 [Halobiforma haloterrestris]|uniref:Uncharacterized protein n=1 Tax=Natronobacterium haloterrestre TaxID=148448 RepID=A0A1I1KFU2_NATHA|nr:hypothetical protein [Halobiforma haloterrestris]SFC59834.1 hypothetical protein SAMN05444422_111115 [Halobiforma haloterrestris]
MTDRLTLQWRPTHGPPRRYTFEREDDSWHRIESVWTGREWRVIGSELTDAPTIETNATLDTPTTPPTLETLTTHIQNTWTTDDPVVLAFGTTSPDVVASVDGDLRQYTDQHRTWKSITTDELTNVLQRSGLPEIKPLSETPYSRSQFTNPEVPATDD